VARRLYEEVDICQPYYRERYPTPEKIGEYDPQSNVAHGNLFIKCVGEVIGGAVAEGNILTPEEDPGFVNAAAGDFRLRRDAPVLQALPRLAEIPFGEIGMAQDELWSDMKIFPVSPRECSISDTI
jgi:hypothetical protein